MDREQNVMPEQADVLYASSADDSSENGQEEEEEPDTTTQKVLDVSDAPLWLLLLVLFLGVAQTALGGVIWRLPTWLAYSLFGIVQAAWMVLIIFLARQNRRSPEMPKK